MHAENTDSLLSDTIHLLLSAAVTALLVNINKVSTLRVDARHNREIHQRCHWGLIILLIHDLGGLRASALSS